MITKSKYKHIRSMIGAVVFLVISLVASTLSPAFGQVVGLICLSQNRLLTMAADTYL
jgi:hypothetical protein